jgi:type IV pilus assembly protein PilM
MALFSGNKKSYIGIDLGTSAIKVVEMADEAGRPRLVTYGSLEQRNDIVRSDSTEVGSAIIASLNAIRQKSHITTKGAVAALPSFAVFSSIISLPAMSKKELLAAVKWEAKKFVPMPLEEMILDWRLLKEGVVTPSKDEQSLERTKGAKHLKVLLTAAPRSVVKRYVDIARGAGLELLGLETEAFALERSLVGSDRTPVLIVDVGAVATDLSIVAGGIPVLNRSIDVGGDTVTKAIANAMNIDLARAEQFKRDVGMVAAEGGVSQIPRTIEFVVASIVNEIRYVFNLYRAQSDGAVEKIILSGGSAFIPNLPDYLEKTVGIKVVIGDPFARTIYPVELKPALDEIGPAFAVAVGLAMRPIL